MEDASNDHRACPLCAEPIRVAAVKCRHCGSDVRDGAVVDFLNRGESVDEPTPAPPVTPAAPPPAATPSRGEVARLTTGLVGHWVTLGAIAYVILLIVWGAGFGSSRPSITSVKIMLSLFYILGGVGYALIGIGWTATTRVATRHALGCAVTSFLHTLVGIIAIIAVAMAEFNKNQKDSEGEWMWMPLVLANGVYMLSLAYWYWAAGLAVLDKKGRGGFTDFMTHLGYPVLALLAGLLAFPAVLASDDKAKLFFLFLSLVMTAVCWVRVFNHFYIFRHKVEAAVPD